MFFSSLFLENPNFLFSWIIKCHIKVSFSVYICNFRTPKTIAKTNPKNTYFKGANLMVFSQLSFKKMQKVGASESVHGCSKETQNIMAIYHANLLWWYQLQLIPGLVSDCRYCQFKRAQIGTNFLKCRGAKGGVSIA